MKKLLILGFLPAALMLGACGTTPIESSSSSASEAPASSASASVVTSSDEGPIPTVTPTLVLTVASTTPVLDENTVYVASSAFEGATPDEWGYVAATKGTDGTWSVTFPETEVDMAIEYVVTVANTESGFSWNYRCDECANNKSLSFTIVEGQTTYNQTVTFSSQPSSSAMHEEITITLTVKNSEGAVIGDYLNLWAWDNLTQATNLWTKEGSGVYSRKFQNVNYGASVEVNGCVCVSDTAADWTCEFSARVFFTITESATSYTSDAAVPTDKIPADPSVTTYYDVTYQVVLPEAAPQAVSIVFEGSTNWHNMTSNGDGTYTLVREEVEGTVSFYVATWGYGTSASNAYIYQDAYQSYFFYQADADKTVTVTGDFDSGVGVLSTSAPISYANVTFNYTATETIPSDQVVQIVDSNDWNKMTLTDGVWTITLRKEVNVAYSFYVYTYNEGNLTIHADANGTNFSVTPTADCTVTITGTFASGVGTITVA